MKHLLSFIAGLLTGLVLGWWLKPKPNKTAKFVFVGEGKPHFNKETWAEPCANQVEVDGFIGTPDGKGEIHWRKKGAKPCQEQEEAHTSLADTQPIKVNPDYIEPDFL